MSNGKGSGRRPAQISEQEYCAAWDRVFSKHNSAASEYFLSGEDIVEPITDLSYAEYQQMAADYDEELSRDFANIKEISALEADEGAG